MARGTNTRFGRKGLVHIGQLTKNGKRTTFKTKGDDLGIRENPEYMKVWSEAATVMKQRRLDTTLEGFWPQLDSQEVIKRNSPVKKKADTINVWGAEIQVEEEATWKTKTPEKTGTEQEKRMAAIEKTQEEQSTLVTTLTAALEKKTGWNVAKYSPKPALPSKTQTEQLMHS
jgi:hypothetical protein